MSNKRIKKKRLKQEFLQHFTKKDWAIYRKYPRLFSLHYTTNKRITLDDINYWYSKFINLDIPRFEVLVMSLYAYVTHNEEEYGFKTKYPNLTKYDFKYLMNNINNHEILYCEKFPIRIRYILSNHIKEVKFN